MSARRADFPLCSRTARATVEFLAQNEEAFLAQRRKRPELAGVMTTSLLSVPQVGVTVDTAKVLTQQVSLAMCTRPCKPSWAEPW